MDEGDDLERQLGVSQKLSFTVILGQSNELEGSGEVQHVEIGNRNAAETIDPSGMQIDSLTEPVDRTMVLLQLAKTDCHAIDEDVIVWVLTKPLLVIVHSCIYLTNFGALQALLLPEFYTIHLFDMTVELKRFPIQFWHAQRHVDFGLVRLLFNVFI